MARRWRGPQFPGDFPSLGYELAAWAETFLVVPMGRSAGRPFVMGGWQFDTLVRFYGLNPRTGRFAYRRAVLELSKGMGKSPWAAAVAWMELLAPTVFDHWAEPGEVSEWGWRYEEGDPVGRPQSTPWIQVAATAEDQTDNTWKALIHEARDAPLERAYGVEIGETRVFVKRGFGQIEPVTSKAGTRVGQQITFAIKDETHVWLPGNGGPKLSETLTDNLLKSGGRSVETTNAYEPGAGSVAEASAKAAQAAKNILHVAFEAPPVKDPKDPEELRPALEFVYAESAPWVDIDLLVEDCMAEDKSPLSIRRMFLNHKVASEARFLRDEWIDAALDDGAVLEDGAPVALGFDGSKTRDGTAIVATHMETGQAFLLGSWRRPPFADRSWEVPRAQVMDQLFWAFGNFQVARLKMDPAYWQDELAQLQHQFGRQVVDRFPTAIPAVVDEAIGAVQTSFEQAARVGRKLIGVWGDVAPLVEDLRAAQIVTATYGTHQRKKLVKPDDGRKIDCAAALCYAEQARREALKGGWQPPPPSVDPLKAIR